MDGFAKPVLEQEHLLFFVWSNDSSGLIYAHSYLFNRFFLLWIHGISLVDWLSDLLSRCQVDFVDSRIKLLIDCIMYKMCIKIRPWFYAIGLLIRWFIESPSRWIFIHCMVRWLIEWSRLTFDFHKPCCDGRLPHSQFLLPAFFVCTFQLQMEEQRQVQS